MMRVLRIAALLLVACVSAAWSQEKLDQTAPDDTVAERARIDGIRQRRTVELDAEESACLSKFAVTDCQSEVGKRRRRMLAELKRQNAKLNEIERLQKVVEQAQKSKDKAVEGAQRERAMHAGADNKTEEERQKDLNAKVLNHQNQAKPGRTPSTKSTSALDAATVEKNRAAYHEKLEGLDKRRQERDKRLQEHGTGGPPLPVKP